MKATIIDLADFQFIHLTCANCKGGISYSFPGKMEIFDQCPHCSARWPNGTYDVFRGWKLLQANANNTSVEVRLAISLE